MKIHLVIGADVDSSRVLFAYSDKKMAEQMVQSLAEGTPTWDEFEAYWTWCGSGAISEEEWENEIAEEKIRAYWLSVKPKVLFESEGGAYPYRWPHYHVKEMDVI